MDLLNLQFGQMLKELSRPKPSQRFSKCDNMAEGRRQAGNGYFKKRDFVSALAFYNESLRFATPGSVGLALVYGNRSAVYYEMGKYELSMENIQLARENGFPAEKIAQLDAREARCKDLMANSIPDGRFQADSFFKLSHPPNKKIPFIADCLELRSNVKYGRHIVTTKDLKTGDIIAVEPAAISFFNDMVIETACFHCTKRKSGSLIPCSHCTEVMFCSEECQRKGALYHLNVDKFDEAFRGLYGKSFKMQLEAFRIAGGVDEAVELSKQSADKTIFDFDLSNPEDPFYEKNMLMALNGLCRHVSAPKVGLELLMNTPPINEKPRTLAQHKQLVKFLATQFKICNSNTVTFKSDHHGIFLFKQLLNHSCIPDVECTKIGDKLVMTVNHPIKAGKQIFSSYGVYASDHSKQERIMFLQDQQVKCECIACVKKIPSPFPRKDRSFVEPKFKRLEPAEAVKQFNKNCKYVDENAGRIPCYEIAKTLENNLFLIQTIAGRKPSVY